MSTTLLVADLDEVLSSLDFNSDLASALRSIRQKAEWGAYHDYGSATTPKMDLIEALRTVSEWTKCDAATRVKLDHLMQSVIGRRYDE